MPKHRHFQFVLSILFASGCSGPKFAPVEGKVTLDGKAVAFKSVIFTPGEGTNGSGAAGFTNAEGHYSLTAIVYGTTNDVKGTLPGRYRVSVTSPAIPISEGDFERMEAPKEGANEPAVVLLPNRPRSPTDVPAIYTSPETTPLIFEIPQQGGVFDVELKSQR